MNRKFDLLKVLAIVASTLTAILLTIHDHYSSKYDMTSGDDWLHPKALFRPPAAARDVVPYRSYNANEEFISSDRAADVRGQDDNR